MTTKLTEQAQHEATTSTQQLAELEAVYNGFVEHEESRGWPGDEPLWSLRQRMRAALDALSAATAEQETMACASCGLTHAASRWCQGTQSGWEECRLRAKLAEQDKEIPGDEKQWLRKTRRG